MGGKTGRSKGKSIPVGQRQTAESLRASEIRYKNLFLNAREGLLIVNAKTGQIEEANQFFVDLLGYTHKELLGKKLWEIGAFVNTKLAKTAFRELRKTGYVKYEGLPLKTKSGRLIKAEFISYIYSTDVGKLIQCNIRDITERKKAEESLRASEIRYKNLFKSARDGLLIVNAETGQIEDVNPFITDLLGYTHKEVLGKKLWEIGAFVNTKLAKTAFRELRKKGYVRYENMPLKTKSGRLIQAEFISYIYSTDVGKLIQCNIRNITERKKDEETLKEREGRLSGIFNNAYNCIVVYTAEKGGKDFIIQDFNHAAERVEKVKKKDVLGKRITSVFPGVKKFGLLAVFRRVWKSGKPEHFPAKVYKDQRITGWRDNYLFKLRSGELVVIYSDLTKEKQVEAALVESEEKYRTLIEQSLEGIIIAQGTGPQIVFANPALANILGYSIEELLLLPPKKISRLVHPEDREMFFKRFRGRLRGKTPPARYEFRAIRKDGKEIWLAVSSKRITHLGNPAVQAAFTDVTMGRVLEDILKESEEKYKTLVESSQDLIMLTQADGTISYLSPACQWVLGWKEKDLIGKKASVARPEDRAMAKTALSKALMGESGTNLEYRIITKKGKVKWVSHSWSPIMLHGKLKTVSSTVRDITVRKNALDALRDSKEKYRILTKSMNDVIYSLDMNGIMTYISPSVKQYGFDPQKMVSRHFREFILSEDVEKVMKDFQRSFKSGTAISTEFRIHGKRGKIHWIEDNGKFQYDESGKPTKLTGILRDITERKKFEEFKKVYTFKLESQVRTRTKDLLEQKRKAEALTEMKDRFVRDIGHELKTPLSIILGDLELLKEIAPAGREREWSKLLDMMDRNASRLETSINKMLQLYKITQVEAKRERVYLKETLTEIYNEYLPLAKMRELEFKIESKPAVIIGDNELLQIVLSNLVSNAIKFTERGSVHVEIKPSKKYVSISVSDTGKGISPENQKKLFEKFFKVDPSAPGTGIGLKITKEIVEKHKGKLKVNSKLGQGSTFTITLPRGVEK